MAIKRISKIGIIVFLFLYVFSIPAFSGRPVWYLISYFLMALFGAITLFYTVIYTKVSFNKWFVLPLSFILFAGVGTIIYSHNFRMWLTLFLMFLTMVIFYYAFIAILDKRVIFKLLTFAFLFFAFYFGFVYRGPILHLQFTSARLGTYFDNVNTIGFYFAIGFSLSLYLGIFQKYYLIIFQIFLLQYVYFYILFLKNILFLLLLDYPNFLLL